MGLEAFAPRAEVPALSALVDELHAAGLEVMVVMIDGALVSPRAPKPEAWRDVRVRTPAGTLTLLRRDGGIAVVVFGNADEPLRAMQQRLAAVLTSSTR